ncbi:MAG: response regulator [Ignavibacteria bacterium]|nr:response regulator [Ignavibacteria bacterium]
MKTENTSIDMKDITAQLTASATVLVVDDNALILQLVSSLLTKVGYRVSFATNGKQAISVAQTAKVDLILLDVQMPEIDGYEVCEHLKSMPETKDIPIIFLTAKSETEDLTRGYEAGGVDYVTKPFNPTELLARVNSHINLKRALELLKKQKDEELKDSEQRFEQMAEQTNEMIWEIDNEGLYTYVSPGSELIYGYPPDEMAGKMHFYDLHPEEGRESFKQAVLTILSFRKPFRELINAGQTKAGKTVWVTSNGLPIQNRQGELIGYRGTDYDITERKNAEDALRESELRYRSLIENAFDAIYLIRNGRFEYINQHFVTMTGYTLEEVTSLQFDHKWIFTSEVVEGSLILPPGKKNISRRYETKVWNKNNELIDVEISTACLSINGSISELGIIRDITERNRMVNELKTAKEKAEEMNRLKSHFLALVSHELRTPLNGILGFSQLLEEELLEPDLKTMASVISRSSRRLKGTVGNLLDLTRIEANSQDVAIVRFDCLEQVFNSAQLFTPFAEERGLQLQVQPSDQTLPILADATLFKSILDNLIDNAIKYTDHGSVTVSTGKESVNGRDYCYIEVIDTGIGIPDGMQKVIFEEFRQVSEGMDRGFEGTGLGLTIAKRYTEMMYGHISLESEPGKGSIFRISFPAAPVAEGEVLKTEKYTAKLFHQRKTEDRPLHVLSIDDDPNTLALIKRTLQEMANVQGVPGPVDALEKLQSNEPFDIILLDINLGRGQHGMRFITKVRELPGYENTPIVAVTAYAMSGDKEEFLQHGCSHYLAKPFEPAELQELIKNISDNL